MALKSMMMDAEEADEQGVELEESGERYPYGLRLSIDDGSLEKLGLTKMPSVGETFTITAQVKVVSTRSYEDEDGEPENSSDWQITAMEVGSSSSSSSDAASMLYS